MQMVNTTQYNDTMLIGEQGIYLWGSSGIAGDATTTKVQDGAFN
jgi:hypothetical protein